MPPTGDLVEPGLDHAFCGGHPRRLRLQRAVAAVADRGRLRRRLLSVVFDVASFAYIPALVSEGDLAAANRAIQGSATSAQVGGPGLAGVLIQTLGAPLAFVVTQSAIWKRAGRRRRSRQGSRARADSVCRDPRRPPLDLRQSNPACTDGPRNLLQRGISELHSQPCRLRRSRARSERRPLRARTQRRRRRRLHRHARRARPRRACRLWKSIRREPRPLDRRTSVRSPSSTRFALVRRCAERSPARRGHRTRQRQRPLNHPTTGDRAATSLARSNGGYRLLIFGAIPIGSILGGLIGHAAGTRVGIAAGAAGLVLSAIPMFQRQVRTLRDASSAREDAAPPTSP
jgi:hypothetical protein